MTESDDTTRYNELNYIREHIGFTSEETKEWLALCTKILYDTYNKVYPKDTNV